MASRFESPVHVCAVDRRFVRACMNLRTYLFAAERREEMPGRLSSFVKPEEIGSTNGAIGLDLIRTHIDQRYLTLG